MNSGVSVTELNSGEYLALLFFEIASIPTATVLQSDYVSGADVEEEYRKFFGSLATEIHQNYGSLLREDRNGEVSAEILWITEPVSNQAYLAKIRLFVVLRCVSKSKACAQETTERVGNACMSAFRLQKYGIREYINYSELEQILRKVPEERTLAVVKAERIEVLNNQIMPFCYGFDVFHSYAKDMGAFVDALTMHPNSLVSFQILPTAYREDENSVIIQMAQTLNTLGKGIMSPGMGNISFSAAEKMAETYGYYQENRNAVLFQFNILVSGESTAVTDIAAKLQGYISYDASKQVRTKSVAVTGKTGLHDNYAAFPWVASEIIQYTERNDEVWESRKTPQSFFRLPYVVTAEEAAGLFAVPIGTNRVRAGLPVSEAENTVKNYAENLINSGDIEIGDLKSSQGDKIGIMLSDLAKHMLVVGTPGSGKTTFSVSLLDRLWKKHHIPFLVIEPAKNEYRALIQSIPELQVFTPGKNQISPFVFNPFIPPKNVRLETYKSTLKTAFAAGVSMSSPLDKIFEEAIHNCYSDFRWLDHYTSDDQGQVFNITDFIKCFQETFDSIGYTGDAKNIGRAGVVRLKSLVRLFDQYYSIPIEDLLEKPTVLELAAIENSDEKALIIALLLLSVLAYVNANYTGEGGLKNIILLEEAHVLLDSESTGVMQDTNPSAIAKKLLKRMLAEIRSYGVGIIIADQSPRKVTEDVVALTDIKMAFRLVEATDRQIISDSMNMSEVQKNRLSRLKPGEAMFFFHKLDDPEEVKTPDYRLENNIKISLSDDGIRELSTYWRDRPERLRPYPECKHVECCRSSCSYQRRVLAREIARRIFVRYFKSDTKDIEVLKHVFGKISKLVQSELNHEPFSPELLVCTKAHLWRKIKYETKIKVSDELIIHSLEKYSG